MSDELETNDLPEENFVDGEISDAALEAACGGVLGVATAGDAATSCRTGKNGCC
jgi:hypothetical protein